jgi:hypothetical protein
MRFVNRLHERRKIIFGLLLTVVPGTIIIGGPVWAGPSATIQPTPTLEAVPVSYDFGRRRSDDTSLIRHIFVLRSHAKTPITVDELQPSCCCTTAGSDRETVPGGPFVIPPGQTARIGVTVDPSDQESGKFEKEVYVFVKGESAPRLTLEIHGIILPPTSHPSQSSENREKKAK